MSPYAVSIERIGPRLRERMRHTHHPGCPVPLAQMRYLRLRYVGFDGAAHTGEIAVHERYAGDVAQVFHRLYDARWPIRRMRLVDDYSGDDVRSMAADNTSGFNCRPVSGQLDWSDHAYGAAIDLNPAENPDLTGATLQPPSGAPYADIDRSRGPRWPRGAIRRGDVVVRAFRGIGWVWGGDWSGGKDYQHFAAPRH
jgi:poly-gamma-glutamate synthesis protein (capsule biosynthesis protein)